ncbi:amidohydrolase family protein [Gandjariella thermophila]|uniref:Amidohydrolase n=1 Tax=Gandjariella thermophila TaxID=1931992 RepID=A0A4D4J915_9PSEU|nr:amidohydrolase family protein [Gandjariella thermophila]GDY31732.1 amidohydrolase [Gandjariella thermophila]
MRQLIITDQVLPGPHGERIPDGAVLVDGDTITEVGPRAEVEHRAGPGARRHDFPGCAVLPGLINCHVHLAFDAGSDPVGTLRASDDETLLPAMAERARDLLRCGVTTARDLGDRGGLAARLRDTINRGEVTGPRLLTSGAPLTIRDGHCWFLGGVVTGESEIRERVWRTAEAGADLIKVMASGGQLTPNSPPMWQSQFGTEDLRVVVEEAGRAGLRVAAHAHGTEAIASAVDAGVTTVEHCTWMGPEGQDRREDVARRMAARGIYACAASSRNWRAMVEKFGPDRAGAIYGRLTWLDSLGVPLITGTDAGLPGSVFDDFVGALELYEYLGFPPGRIIEMATVTSAAALGLGDEVGRLAPGYRADLLVVAGDPLAGLEALRHRRLLLARGRAVEGDQAATPTG